MARVRKTESDQVKLKVEKEKLLEAIFYADSLSGYEDSSIWQAMSKALRTKVEQYQAIVNELIDNHRRGMTPDKFQIEVTIARRSAKICQELIDMPRNMLAFKAQAQAGLDRIERELRVKPGSVFR